MGVGKRTTLNGGGQGRGTEREGQPRRGSSSVTRALLTLLVAQASSIGSCALIKLVEQLCGDRRQCSHCFPQNKSLKIRFASFGPADDYAAELNQRCCLLNYHLPLWRESGFNRNHYRPMILTGERHVEADKDGAGEGIGTVLRMCKQALSLNLGGLLPISKKRNSSGSRGTL